VRVAAVTQSDVERHLRRYATYDQSPGAKDGIPVTTALSIPEFASNALYPRILQIFVDRQSQLLRADRFLQLCALMSSGMPTSTKKRCALLSLTTEVSTVKGVARLKIKERQHYPSLPSISIFPLFPFF